MTMAASLAVAPAGRVAFGLNNKVQAPARALQRAATPYDGLANE